MSVQRRTLAISVFLLMGTTTLMADSKWTYPTTKKVNQVDDYHGTKVADLYRWLEEDVRKSQEVQQWVKAQNELTEKYLRSIPERETIRKRLTELWNFERFGTFSKVGNRYFFFKNDGLQNQSVLYVLDRLDGEAKVLIDPNTWSKDGTIALKGTSFSDDGRWLVYATSEAGSDWETWKVLDVETGKPLADELKWVKFSAPAAWTKDGRGFFYSRYDEPQKEAQFQSLNLNQKLMYHRLGTPQSEDVLVYARPDHPDWGFGATVTEDGRYLVISTWKGTDNRYRITYRDLNEPYGLPVDLIDHFDNNYSFVGNDGTTFFFRTDLHAPKGRLIAIDIRKPAPEHWKEIIPQAEENLDAVSLVGNLFIASYLKDAKTQVKLFQMDGRFLREVAFPTLGTAAGFEGKRTDTETFYSFNSFIVPPSIYRYDLLTGESKLVRQSKVALDLSPYETKQVFVTSKDGTKVPMFITARKDIVLDGSNPVLLYGYGGFNISLRPTFSVAVAAWLEMGGVYASANLRGGGEYGKEWHKAGTKRNKQNVFDDFIACAEWLIQKKYTSPSKLAIKGESNGGLLVGACMTQRPELFGACLPGVGVMDMLRFQHFTAGRFWVDDYGSSANPEEFQALYRYSPYHNLKPGVRYPATLVTTADTDDRVVPGHSFKFTAAIQEAQAGDAPVLARIETKAGHGAGKPTAKIIEETADRWAFLVKNLNMKLPTKANP